MNKPNIIAIDGPAASGKSTVAKILADTYGYLYFDTGVMYRAVTCIALQTGIAIDDESSVTRLAETVSIDVRPPSRDDGRSYDVWVDGQDITWEIRSSEVDAHVSVVSAYRGVRQALSQQQRRIGLRGNVVMVGRDIGTVVLPEADLKIYLVASVEQRARRRHEELLRRGEEIPFEEILESMKMRDQIDSTRDISPLRAAEDAILIDSDRIGIEQVVERVTQLINGSLD